MLTTGSAAPYNSRGALYLTEAVVRVGAAGAAMAVMGEAWEL
jgi:hypothetical protein